MARGRVEKEGLEKVYLDSKLGHTMKLLRPTTGSGIRMAAVIPLFG